MERIDKIFCLGNFGIEFVKVGKNLYKYYGGSGYRFSLFASFYSPLVVFSIAGPYKKWQKILMKISEGFKAYKEIQEHDSYMIPTGYYHEDGILKGTEKMVINKKKLKELQRKQKRGLVLFAKWFNHIWD